MTTLRRGRVVLIGAVHEARPALSGLLHDPRVDLVAVVTSSGMSRQRTAGAVDLISPAAAAGVPVIVADDVNAAGVVAGIAALAPDLIVVVGWTRLICPELLAVPRVGCVGFHASLLPANRGRAPVNWAILRGEKTTGNTMMMLDPGVDTGDIVDQEEIAIGPGDTCATVYDRIGRSGARMLRDNLPALLSGCVPRRHQASWAGEVLPRRTPAMGILDWDQPPVAVHDWVRALTVPYPGAFTRFNGHQVMIWTTQPPLSDSPAGSPGEILSYERDGVRIGARGGSVLVTRMSDPDHRPEPARRWLRRSRLEPGDRFDPVPPEVARWAYGEGESRVLAQ
jgi:methionyl-tRNA formyltransferase